MATQASTHQEFVGWAHANYSAILAVDDADLERPVPDCPGWTIGTVVNHLDRGNFAFLEFLRKLPSTNLMPSILASLPDRLDGNEAVESARASTTELFDLLGVLDPTQETFVFAAPGTVGDWCVFIAAETWVHKVDVAHALGEQTPKLSPDLGAVAMMRSANTRTMLARRLGIGDLHAVRCHATDSGAEIILGDQEPQRELIGEGGDIALRLWNRQHGPLNGDGAEIAAWAAMNSPSPLD